LVLTSAPEGVDGSDCLTLTALFTVLSALITR
jgi:hypothetical protein